MKKIVAIFLIVLVIGGFILFQNSQNNSSLVSTVPSSSPLQSQTPGSNATPSTGGSGYKDGSYTGQVADATYGNLQVQVTVKGGKITDIAFLQFPNSGGHTQEVSTVALPLLKQEAIAAQSANVNAVSGASQTSQAFVQTLQSALDQAKI